MSHLILIKFVVQFIGHSVAPQKKAKAKVFIGMLQLHLWEKRLLYPVWFFKLNTPVNKEKKNDLKTISIKVHYFSCLRIFISKAWTYTCKVEWFPDRAYFVMPQKQDVRHIAGKVLFFSSYGLAGLDSKKKKICLSPLHLLSAIVRIQEQ